MSSAFLKKFQSIETAEIEWRDNLPFNLEFEDVYFSDSGGLAESKHVFIEGNQLTTDWLQASQQIFSIAELGFGTGLNFLATARHWQQIRQENNSLKDKYLDFVSIEKSPLKYADFKRACECWAEFSDLSCNIIARYPSPTFGRHQIQFSSINLRLILIYMPVTMALQDLIDESQSQQHKTAFDHWFLDGFAPDKNNEMWEQSVCQQIALLSKSGTRAATYSVAASVKNPLTEVGFAITKRPGFGRKREMLTAEFKPPQTNKILHQNNRVNLKRDKPWFNIKLSEPALKIAVIGAGIAGCSTAYSLSKQGFSVDLFDAENKVAAKASGAAAGIFHPQLTADINYSSQFSWAAYLTFLQFLDQLDPAEKDIIVVSQGVNRILPTADAKVQLLEFSRNYGLQHWIQNSADFQSNQQAIFFPHAAAIDIAKLCELLISKCHKNRLTLHLNTQIKALSHENNLWRLSTAEKSYAYSHIVFCGGANSELLSSVINFPTNTTRGQTSTIAKSNIDHKLNKVLCEKVYLVPTKNDNVLIGGTFDSFIDDQLNQQSQLQLLEDTQHLLTKMKLAYTSSQDLKALPLAGTVGYRLHSSDRLPIVGGVVELKKLQDDFNLRGNKLLLKSDLSTYNKPGLWLNTAFGSHGLLYSLLASQHLTSLISNTLSPINHSLGQALHPARFIMKAISIQSKIPIGKAEDTK